MIVFMLTDGTEYRVPAAFFVEERGKKLYAFKYADGVLQDVGAVPAANVKAWMAVPDEAPA